VILRYLFPVKVAANSRERVPVDAEVTTKIPSTFLASKQLGDEAHSVLYEEVPFTVSITD
jgi:hypothetical protein